MSDYIARLVSQLAGQIREEAALPCDRDTILRQAEKAEQNGNSRLAAKLREAALLAPPQDSPG